ncbi:phosphatidylglycerol--membrane-oligosaccharide glycerophosphotransferase [Mixta theicola]|uniref:Phosphatidylglycerol--membrane-oligosaccharide glycerophosphotransferase n=1 Tax=Mixta theicola TaxID=1458355 RepID=A0A2K1Q592_9GAMM|nr:phosphatidylglycerol--membrane-oligosaccharide glycerophosphotransferase [Mixta theicola]PNS10203.1 phosphatidylglycerol--membrane-oligosaccharide glycerophosphotransferase [Mixta theicola]GLR08507.1 phosphoglycerol transferase I [Mixta theicola]
MSELSSVILFMASIAIYAYKAGRNTFWYLSLLLILGLFIILNATLYASNYFTGEGINDAVIYTLTNSLTGAGVSKYVLPGIGLVLALFLVFCLLSWLLRRRGDRPHHFGYSLLALLLALASIKTTPAFQQVTDLIVSQTGSGSADFARWYHEPQKRIAKPTLNLVYIYGESLERTYFDEQAFPHLAPELSRLKRQQALDFTQTEQLPGTEYTIAGMVASQCGIPLFAPFEGNASAALSSFFPQNVCLGDILKNSGYQTWFMQGADLRFAGKDTFLKSHGIDHLYGLQELKDRVADPSYRNNWGFYDDTVMDEVWQKFEQLSQQKQPFALFTLTVDTHHPDGFISRSCQHKSYSYEGKPNQSLSAVACSQEHVARLIERILASPWAKNTLIVVSSDHLAMNNTAWEYLNAHQRDNLFMIIRGDRAQPQLLTMKRSSLDNGATVLDLLGGDKAIGLGRSSLSDRSLSEQFEMKKKVLEWKPDVIQLWGFPKHIDRFSVDQQKNSISFSGAHFSLPLLLKIGKDKVEPLPEGEYAAPLRYQLADFAAGDKFVWVDRCFKMARLWQPALAISADLCVAQGQLGAQPQVQHIDKASQEIAVTIPQQPLDQQRWQQNVAALKIADHDLRYRADSFKFDVPGAPLAVKEFSGISRPEGWGRWSNANLAPEVTIDYAQPLPPRFELIIRAKAFGPNAQRPIPVRVGGQQQMLTLSHEVSTVTLRFTNPEGSHRLVITPPEPQLSNEGNIIGQDPRKLGIGLVEIKIVPVEN